MSRREQLSGLAEVSKYVLFLAGLHTSKKQDIREHLCQGAARQSISVGTAMLCMSILQTSYNRASHVSVFIPALSGS